MDACFKLTVIARLETFSRFHELLDCFICMTVKNADLVCAAVCFKDKS